VYAARNKNPIARTGLSVAGISGRDASAASCRWSLIAATALAAMLGVAVGCASGQRATSAASVQSVTAAGITSDPQVRQILAESCFDCHADTPASAWYVHLAPSHWFGSSARQALDFSRWNDYSAARRTDEIDAIARVVTRGQMPPFDYTLFHPAARLTNQQKDIINAWKMKQTTSLISAH
jgi:uncharacterized membrane protein